jgi:RimJ/RimL family protein N-acetyltransferase
MGLKFKPLTTERLNLRSITHRDDDAFMRIFSNPETMKYWSREPFESPEEARKMVQEEIDWGESGKCANWGVAFPEGDALIGKVNLFNFEEQHCRAEVGYAFNPLHWNRGFATEAVRAVLDYAFGPLGLHRIEADVDPENLASLSLLKKFGFTREGYLHDRFMVHGVWHDSVVLGLLDTDYRQIISRADG